ncbi:thioredoxin family protein [bacterium]|nr:thioredoxin family protein [bacterium]
MDNCPGGFFYSERVLYFEEKKESTNPMLRRAGGEHVGDGKMNGKPGLLILTEANFRREVIEAAGPVLVVFETDWSGSYRIIAPFIEEMALRYQGRIKLGKLDVDANKRIADEYSIRTLPTLIFFKNGQIVDFLIGICPKNIIENLLGSILLRDDS